MALIGGSPAARVVDSVTTPDLISALRCMWSSFFFFFLIAADNLSSSHNLMNVRRPAINYFPLGTLFCSESTGVSHCCCASACGPTMATTVRAFCAEYYMWHSDWLKLLGVIDSLRQSMAGYLHVHRRKTNGTDYFRLTAISSPTCQQSRRLERATFY